MRKPSRSVELDDIISSHILGDDPEVVALVMRIHLALEAILIEMIKTFWTDDKIYKLSFPQKTKLLLEHGCITESDQKAFELLNDFRNDFSHIFGHRINLTDSLKLARISNFAASISRILSETIRKMKPQNIMAG